MHTFENDYNEEYQNLTTGGSEIYRLKNTLWKFILYVDESVTLEIALRVQGALIL